MSLLLHVAFALIIGLTCTATTPGGTREVPIDTHHVFLPLLPLLWDRGCGCLTYQPHTGTQQHSS